MRYRLVLPLLLAASLGAQVRSLRIQVLSTMLADPVGVGEWGFAALIEVDGRRILFDTGARPETVLNNVAEMKIDLSGIADVVLSHNHGDHTGGLMTLRRALMAKSPKNLSVVHVGKGIFFDRPQAAAFTGKMTKLKAAYERTGGRFVEYVKAAEIYPGVWFTGPVPRKHPERNWPAGGTIATPEGEKEDNLPEDMSMVFRTEKGLVVLSGCGHAGVINTLEQARSITGNSPVYAIVGGLHLFQLDDEKLQWTASKLREFGLQHFLGAHCTGIEATYRIRQLNGMTRQTAAVAAVGASFDLSKGMDPGRISR